MMAILLRLVIFLALTLTTSACEVTPWSNDADCQNLKTSEQIEKLIIKESNDGRKDHFKVFLVGDPQGNPANFEKIIEYANRRSDSDFLFVLGDLTDMGLAQEFDWACKIMRKSNKPIIPVIGNHDAISFGKEIWFKLFGDFDFSFQYQGSQFIIYNDNKFEFENLDNRQVIEEAVNNIEITQIDHRIAIAHHRPWSEDLGFNQFLFDMGLSVTIHGHGHHFDYWLEDDVELPHYMVNSAKNVSYGIMTVYPDSIEFEDCYKDSCVPAILQR